MNNDPEELEGWRDAYMYLQQVLTEVQLGKADADHIEEARAHARQLFYYMNTAIKMAKAE